MAETITWKDSLLRRIRFSDPNYIKDDGSLNSYAFLLRKKDKDGISVDLKRLSNYDISIEDEAVYKLYKLLAKVPMDLGLGCKHKPIDNNPAHSVITGIPMNKKHSRQLRRTLAKAAVFYPRPL